VLREFRPLIWVLEGASFHLLREFKTMGGICSSFLLLLEEEIEVNHYNLALNDSERSFNVRPAVQAANLQKKKINEVTSDRGDSPPLCRELLIMNC
jgi:hypothetical protein